MRQYWTIEELAELWSLLPDERLLLRNKTGKTRLGFAVGLKFFQFYGKFPQSNDHIPLVVIEYIANQVAVDLKDEYFQYFITKEHRKEIRDFLGFCPPTDADREELIDWLATSHIPDGAGFARIKEAAYQHLYHRSVEPFTTDRMVRYIKSALQRYEDSLFQKIYSSLSVSCKNDLHALLQSGKGLSKKELLAVDEVRLRHIKKDAGRSSLNTILMEAAKLQAINKLDLPTEILKDIYRKILKKYSNRVLGDLPGELKKRPEGKGYPLLAIFCYVRGQEITDSLVELLIQTIHRLKTKAEEKITQEVAGDISKVENKNGLLYKIAKAVIQDPDTPPRKLLFPLFGEQIFHDLIKESESKGGNLRENIYTVIRSSYSHHYRRMLPPLLEALVFRANTEGNKSIIAAVTVLNKYINSQLINYPEDEKIPTENIIPDEWRSIVIEKDGSNNSYKINRINYEIAVLHTLREHIRCKEIWVKNSYQFRDPDEDLPADFNQNREEHYTSLKLPMDKYEFTSLLKKRMRTAINRLNNNIKKNDKVKILAIKKRKKKRIKGWICLTPLKPQPEPQNINKLKDEMLERWTATSLLDILKEADFQVDFTSCFKSTASREILDRKTIQERLLLCLFGVATNIGVKRIRSGNQKISHQDLRYIYRRFIDPVNTREAIAKIVNAIFKTRDPNVWGEATTACASDAKQFGAWDQNLMTEWHARYRGSGIMVYWHVDKKSACIYSQTKSCSSSEVAAMIEGVLRHCTDMEVKKNYTDTRGQSIIGFAFSYLLGFELLPRLANIGTQKLNLPEPLRDNEYMNLQPILTKPINWDLIHAQYDLIIKYATALRLGTADSEIILRRFTRNNAKHPVYKALMELGKAVKTIFLCNYLHSEELRQEIHEGLNVVENWNSVNNFISYAKKGVISTNRKRDQEVSLLCLHLLQIAMVYINTIMIQQILKQPAWQDRLTIEDKRALSPLIHLHINPYGIFNLDLNTRLKLEI